MRYMLRKNRSTRSFGYAGATRLLHQTSHQLAQLYRRDALFSRRFRGLWRSAAYGAAPRALSPAWSWTGRSQLRALERRSQRGWSRHLFFLHRVGRRVWVEDENAELTVPFGGVAFHVQRGTEALSQRAFPSRLL